MTAGPGTAREATERTARAVVAGNLAQIMADLTPEALAQMMAMGASAGSLSPASMPNITAYEIAEIGLDGDSEVFHITFTSAVGRATLAATWRQIMGQWKIAAVSLVSAEASPGNT
jgi:hypothetical protein